MTQHDIKVAIPAGKAVRIRFYRRTLNTTPEIVPTQEWGSSGCPVRSEESVRINKPNESHPREVSLLPLDVPSSLAIKANLPLSRQDVNPVPGAYRTVT